MKLKGEFILREIAGEHILVPVGEKALDFNGIISLNEVGVEIWNGLREGLGRHELLNRLTDAFEAEESIIAADLEEFLSELERYDLLEP